ncbi:MAG: histidine phosphatase family protein [Ilumatobacter sp.]|nr:histidine phosphatase family protein [Ilumatobacter sp.]
MRLIFVRHGAAHAGFNGLIGGPTGCSGLTDRGREQASLLRDHLASTRRLSVDVLLTSLIPRAIETAGIIAPALGFDDVPQDCDLCEVHTGEADGVDWAEYPSRFGSFDMAAEPDRVFAPGGDSWNGFHDRVRSAMDRLAADHRDQTVMAVCHAGVIAASMRVRLGVPTGAVSARLVPTHTGLTEWEHDPATNQWTLRRYDDTRHLDDDG